MVNSPLPSFLTIYNHLVRRVYGRHIMFTVDCSARAMAMQWRPIQFWPPILALFVLQNGTSSLDKLKLAIIKQQGLQFVVIFIGCSYSTDSTVDSRNAPTVTESNM